MTVSGGRTLRERAEKRMAAAGRRISELAEEKVATAIADARSEWVMYSRDPLFMFGVGIYLGEGGKRTCALQVANSDPAVMRSWIKWCRRFAAGLKFRFQVNVHSDDRKQAAKQYWSRVFGDFAEFRGAYVAVSSASKRRRPIERLPNGTASVTMRDGSRVWHAKMMEWIRLATQE